MQQPVALDLILLINVIIIIITRMMMVIGNAVVFS